MRFYRSNCIAGLKWTEEPELIRHMHARHTRKRIVQTLELKLSLLLSLFIHSHVVSCCCLIYFSSCCFVLLFYLFTLMLFPVLNDPNDEMARHMTLCCSPKWLRSAPVVCVHGLQCVCVHYSVLRVCVH